MATNEHDPLHATVAAKLAAVAAADASPPSWYVAWSRLGPESAAAERLAVYQMVRDAGSLPAEAGFYLVAWQVDVVTLALAEQALAGHEEGLAAIKRQHGLAEDDCWPGGNEPPAYAEALQRMHDAWDALYLAQLDAHGEHELARLYRTDRKQFDDRYEAGRQFFHGPRTDDDAAGDGLAWLEALREDVAGCMEVESPTGPLGLQYREEEGFWEVQVYPAPVELVGGRHDGAVVEAGFALDLEQLRAAFASVTACGWHALGLIWPEGPYVYVEGVYRGREVYLQVLAHPPEDAEPGLKIDATPRRRRE